MEKSFRDGHEQEPEVRLPEESLGLLRDAPGAIARASLPPGRRSAGISGRLDPDRWSIVWQATRWRRPRPGRDRLEVPDVAGDRPLRGLGPRHQLALCSPPRRSAVKARATSTSVRVCVASRVRRAAHASGVVGADRSDVANGSRASSRSRRVTLSLRRSSPMAVRRLSRQPDRVVDAGAAPASTGSGWSSISRQALDSASRCPQRLPLSTVER